MTSDGLPPDPFELPPDPFELAHDDVTALADIDFAVLDDLHDLDLDDPMPATRELLESPGPDEMVQAMIQWWKDLSLLVESRLRHEQPTMRDLKLLHYAYYDALETVELLLGGDDDGKYDDR